MDRSPTECLGCGYAITLVRTEQGILTWVCELEDCPICHPTGSLAASVSHPDPESSFIGAKDDTEEEYTSPALLKPDDIATGLFEDAPIDTLPPRFPKGKEDPER
jgi:hypothetical protein